MSWVTKRVARMRLRVARGLQARELAMVKADVDALIAFKQQKEKEELEAKGRYDEAIAKQAQQYRDAEEAKNKRIQELEARQRQLEVEAPAVTALADVVHDPQYVLSRISKD